MEREKRQEFVERTKNILTATESQATSEKSQRSTGGTKKVFHFLKEELGGWRLVSVGSGPDEL